MRLLILMHFRKLATDSLDLGFGLMGFGFWYIGICLWKVGGVGLYRALKRERIDAKGKLKAVECMHNRGGHNQSFTHITIITFESNSICLYHWHVLHVMCVDVYIHPLYSSVNYSLLYIYFFPCYSTNTNIFFYFFFFNL